MNERIHSSSEIIRRIDDLKSGYEVLIEVGKFRIVRLEPPFFSGYEYWVVNEKGFLWEPANDEDSAIAYLETPEAVEYNSGSR